MIHCIPPRVFNDSGGFFIGTNVSGSNAPCFATAYRPQLECLLRHGSFSVKNNLVVSKEYARLMPLPMQHGCLPIYFVVFGIKHGLSFVKFMNFMV